MESGWNKSSANKNFSKNISFLEEAQLVDITPPASDIQRHPTRERKVVLHYDENNALPTNQRPSCDCRGPGALINIKPGSTSPADSDRADNDNADVEHSSNPAARRSCSSGIVRSHCAGQQCDPHRCSGQELECHGLGQAKDEPRRFETGGSDRKACISPGRSKESCDHLPCLQDGAAGSSDQSSCRPGRIRPAGGQTAGPC